VGEGWKIRQSVLNSGEKIQRFPRTLDQIQLGGGGWKIRARVFFIFWKKIQGFPRALSQIQWGRGGKSDPECLKFWRKNSKAPAGT